MSTFALAIAFLLFMFYMAPARERLVRMHCRGCGAFPGTKHRDDCQWKGR